MSKLRVNEITDLNDNLLWNASEGVGGASVSTASGDQTLNEALQSRVIYVDTIADLQALPTSDLVDGQQVQVKEYHAGTGVGGGEFYWDAASEETDDGGSVFAADGVITGRWKRVSPAKSPEHWGAAGDGMSDDTAAVKAWWESGETYLVARRNYLISGTDALLRTVDADDFYADLRSSTFDISQARAYFLRVYIVTTGRNVLVRGGRVFGNDNVTRPLEISTDSVSAGTVSVDGFSVSGVYANDGLSFSSSAIGINVSCEASQIFVNDCRVSGVNRAYVNPGSVASQGISVTNIIASAHITGNVVIGVQSPAGDADADGIAIFSRDRQLVGRQRVKIEVAGNRIQDCKGRFIKLQTTEAHVWGNHTESTGGEIITSFRGIDCQFGGCNIHDNFWNLYSGVTGGSYAVFVLTQVKESGNWESRTVVRDNFVILERELRYLVHAQITGGDAQIEVRDNYVKAINSNGFLDRNLIRLDCNDLLPVGKCRVEVRDNTYPAYRDPAVVLVGEVFSTDATAADKIGYVITSNTNTRVPANQREVVIELSAADTIPYLSNIVISGNNLGGRQGLSAKGLDLNTIPNGNDFHYATDGGTGGLLNAPTGYNRYVHVSTLGDRQQLTRVQGDSFASRTGEGQAWHEFSGVEL